MLSDDELPSVTPPSTAPALKTGILSRRCMSGSSSFLPGINAHRADFARFAHTRHGAQFRTRTDSAPFVASTPRRASQDALRHTANAAAKARVIVERFLEQMKAYHTFHPTFVEKGVYSKPRVGRHFMGAEALETLDKLLSASTSAVVRHKTDESFIATVARVPSVKERMAQHSLEFSWNTSVHSEMHSLVSLPKIEDKHQVSFSLWRREHPNATAEEIRQEQRFWDMERANRWRLSISEGQKQRQKELDKLTGVQFSSPVLQRGSVGSEERSVMELSVDDMSNQLDQRLLWNAFLVGEAASKNRATTSSSAVEFTTGPAPAVEIVSDYRRNTALQEWMDRKWRHHTHRHENAVLRIQCAYRCYRAKVVAAQRRYARRVAFMEERMGEEQYIRMWNRSVRLTTERLNNDDNDMEKAWRAANFVFLKLQAILKARRARKKAEKERESEVMNHAAGTIQRVFRGFLGRELAKAVRFPELFEQKRRRRLQAAVVVLQAVWRGKATRATLRKRLAAALVIQRLVRLSAARARLRYLRSTKRVEQEDAVKQFAARVLLRFLKKCVSWRREYITQRLEQGRTLRRVTRGCIVRIAINREKRRVQHAALVIQRWFRGARGRAVASTRRAERDDFFHHLRCVDATRVIQRAWRRARVSSAAGARRKKVVAEKRSGEEKRDVENAAVTIQRWHRCVREVRRARAEREATRRDLIERECVERIIRFYRAFKSRR